MTEDFALIDFAFSARSPQAIAEAIGRARALQARSGSPGGPVPAGGGFLSRMFRRGAPGARPGLDLLIQPEGTLDPDPLTRVHLTDGEAGQPTAPVRLTAPVGLGGLTLVEFLEGDSGRSVFCEALSAQLPGDEIFYFRHSGSLHPGAHFAFHIYKDGQVTRRAESVSAAGTAPESDWAGIDTGMPHPLETDCLAPPGLPASEIMTPVRQASILEALGLDPGSLFQPMPGDGDEPIVLELSVDPGGAPLSEASAIVGHLKKRRSGPMLRAVPTGPAARPGTASGPVAPTRTPGASAADGKPGPSSGAPLHATPEQTGVPGAANEPLQGDRGTAPSQVRPPTPSPQPAASPADAKGTDAPPRPPAPSEPAAEPPAARPAGSRPARRPGARDLSLPPWEDQKPAPSWEEEVTALLLDAVESALPPEEQAAWLEMLTGYLTSGDLDTALSETLAVIAAGNRPEAERDAAAKRLSALFGRPT